MDQEELHSRILMRDYFERRELNASSVCTDLCANMEPDEMRRYVRFLLGQLEEKQEQMNRVLDDLSELKATSREQSKMLERMVMMVDKFRSASQGECGIGPF